MIWEMNSIYSKYPASVDLCRTKLILGEESLRSVVANVLHNDIVVSEFEFKSRYYAHFQTNNFGTGMDFLIPPTINKIVP